MSVFSFLSGIACYFLLVMISFKFMGISLVDQNSPEDTLIGLLIIFGTYFIGMSFGILVEVLKRKLE